MLCPPDDGVSWAEVNVMGCDAVPWADNAPGSLYAPERPMIRLVYGSNNRVAPGAMVNVVTPSSPSVPLTVNVVNRQRIGYSVIQSIRPGGILSDRSTGYMHYAF